MTRPRTKRQRIEFVVLSVVGAVFLGWFIVNPARDLVVAGYDYIVAAPCVNGLQTAVASYQAKASTFPPDLPLVQTASNYLAIEQRLDEDIAALRCPISAADEQAAFLEVNARWVNMLQVLASGGQADTEKILALGGEASAALDAFTAALKPYGAQ
jgi:hypothetical protein